MRSEVYTVDMITHVPRIAESVSSIRRGTTLQETVEGELPTSGSGA